MTTGSIYDQLEVRPIINGRGPTTAASGSLMEPETPAAMAEAAKHFVAIEDLNRAIGKRIAEVTGAEAGYVACGSEAAMAVEVAARLPGTDPVKIDALPDGDGFPNEIIIHRAHRIPYDRMYR